MKKAMFWLFVVSLTVFSVCYGVIGVKILTGDYDFLTLLHVAFIFYFVCMGGLLYLRIPRGRCPHCGRRIISNVSYCSHCGGKI